MATTKSRRDAVAVNHEMRSAAIRNCFRSASAGDAPDAWHETARYIDAFSVALARFGRGTVSGFMLTILALQNLESVLHPGSSRLHASLRLHLLRLALEFHHADTTDDPLLRPLELASCLHRIAESAAELSDFVATALFCDRALAVAEPYVTAGNAVPHTPLG
jgi:hypothetical protein